MRNSKLLIGTAALALVAGSGIAFSQERSAPGMSQGQGGGQQAPAAQERGGKAGNAQNQGQAQQERGGKAGNAQNQGQAQGGKQGQAQGGKNADQTTGQAPPAAQQEQRGQRGREETGQPAQPKASQERSGQRNGTTGQQKSGQQEQQAPAARNQNQQQQGQPQQPQQAQQPQAQPQQQGQAPRSGAETQGQAGARVQFSTEQRTRIRETIIRGSGAPRVERGSISFAISVGTVVPRTVHLVAVPTLLVEYHPAWRGYMYFIVDDQIIIVEPGTLRIVEVLAV